MMSIALQSKDVIWRRIGDSIVIITDDGKSSHVLNKTAAFIWEKCDGRYGIDKIASQLCEHFEVTLEEARADVRQITEELIQIGIMCHGKATINKRR